MGKVLDALDDNLTGIVCRQPVFFVATAPADVDGHVNLSPKGGAGSFTVIDPTTVAYLDITGSGVETIAHLRDNGRITIMFCRFEGPPLIVRLYGQGRAVMPHDEGFDDLRQRFPADVPAVRSVIRVALDRVATSCGYGVPFMTYDADRDNMRRWAERKGPEGVVAYRAQRNGASIDGLPGLDLHPADAGRATG